VDLYTRLLRDEKALAEEIEASLESRLKARNATFGGRVLCPFAMPQFVSRKDYDHVRATARGIYGPTIKAWKAPGPAHGASHPRTVAAAISLPPPSAIPPADHASGPAPGSTTRKNRQYGYRTTGRPA